MYKTSLVADSLEGMRLEYKKAARNIGMQIKRLQAIADGDDCTAEEADQILKGTKCTLTELLEKEQQT